MIREVFDKLKIALFPRRCAFCGEIVSFDEEYCEECATLEYIETPICLKCGCSKSDCICKKHSKGKEYNGVAAPFYYENSVPRAILNMKKNEMPKLAKEQGKAVANAVKHHYGNIEFDFVTFIPMFKTDEQKRGFNQSKLIADAVSKECSLPLKQVLYKKRKTKMQKRQSAKDRLVNMYNVFDVAKDVSVKDAKVLLVDDVKTTGATLSSAAMTLKAHGASRVYCAVVAIVK